MKPLRLHANENVPAEAVHALRERGHDVVWGAESHPGAPDSIVLSEARREARLLITFDKDFGELVFARGDEHSSGIVLFRVVPRSPGHAAEFIVRVLESRDDWDGHFSSVEADRVRMTPMGPRREA